MPERAVLVSVHLDPRFSKGTARWHLEDEAQELRELTVSSGVAVAAEMGVRRHQPIAGTFVGTGKLEEIAQAVRDQKGTVVIFNQELSPAQQRNIEDAVGAKTLDRTQLILDIFAQRAKSQEGKIQVELAQLRYLLPRLSGKGVMMTRQAGGIGTRGPGEQKLEVDRRRIRERIGRLGQELKKIEARRTSIRSRRKETEVPVVALVGYTNAGKTTLLNRMSGADSTARNQLFTTLDPLARRVRLPDGENIVLTDTVGFLHHLPHHLIESFKATLEEARDADCLLHMMDASHPLVAEHAAAVHEVLKELDLQEKPVITVLNKIDKIEDPAKLATLEHVHAPAVAISAKTGEGMDRLSGMIRDRLALLMIEPVRLMLPLDRQDLIASVYQRGQVIRRQEVGTKLELIARLPGKLKSSLAQFSA